LVESGDLEKRYNRKNNQSCDFLLILQDDKQIVLIRFLESMIRGNNIQTFYVTVNEICGDQ
jgi:hypothetical protein